MKYEQIFNDVEMVQDETLAGESAAEVEVNYEEVLANMYEEMQAQTEIFVEERSAQENVYLQLQMLSGTLLCVFVVSMLEFCWSCMRQWRKNVLKMGE